ncbi:hypothetical protein AB0F18_28100 [Streptomyces sp. NPDC029216]|uniref:DUF7691 family protein n=1 Tax=Streptomyces sp. NPDC029216 TaxID=3154701 RepID=UPI0033F988D4
MSTGSMREAMRLLTAVERTPEQERMLGIVREKCRAVDARLHGQGIDLDVSVARALEELLDGTVSASEGSGYHYALHALISSYFSDTHDLGDWRRQSWLWTVDEELSRAGVPARLAISQILMSGPPVRLPSAGDTTPWMGTFPTGLAAEFVAAHEAVLDRVAPEVRETAEAFLKAIRFEAEEWASADEDRRRNQDTMFFWCS